MTRRTGWAAAVVARIAIAGTLLTALAREGEAGIDWKTDLEAARAEAAESGRPMMVVFR